MTVQTPIEFAQKISIMSYLAGIIDGEGSISIIRVHEKDRIPIYHRISINIVNTNPWIILYAQFIFGGYIHKKKRSDGHWGTKPCYAWQVEGPKAEKTLIELYPYLFLKQRQAKLCLIMRFIKRVFKPLSPELIELYDKIWQRVKDANQTIDRYGLPEEFQCQ